MSKPGLVQMRIGYLFAINIFQLLQDLKETDSSITGFQGVEVYRLLRKITLKPKKSVETGKVIIAYILISLQDINQIKV